LPPLPRSFIPLPHIPGMVSIGIIFVCVHTVHTHTYIHTYIQSYIHTCVHSICTIFTLLHPFLTILLVPTPSCPPGRTCSALLFSDFKEEKLTFWLV
jgi:hypothetical protein